MGRPPGSQITSQEEDLAKVWKKIDKRGPDDCWLWTGSVSGKEGYPQVWGVAFYWKYAHRVLWEELFGPIPENDLVIRSCGEKLCCNPSHFELVTRSEFLYGTNHPFLKERGENHRKAKLTEEKVKSIRELYAQGFGTTMLGETFGVTRNSIYLLCTRKTWKHVPMTEREKELLLDKA